MPVLFHELQHKKNKKTCSLLQPLISTIGYTEAQYILYSPWVPNVAE